MKKYLIKHVPTGKYFEHSEGMDFLVNKDEVETYHRDKNELQEMINSLIDGEVWTMDEYSGDVFDFSDLEIEEVIL